MVFSCYFTAHDTHTPLSYAYAYVLHTYTHTYVLFIFVCVCVYIYIYIGPDGVFFYLSHVTISRLGLIICIRLHMHIHENNIYNYMYKHATYRPLWFILLLVTRGGHVKARTHHTHTLTYAYTSELYLQTCNIQVLIMVYFSSCHLLGSCPDRDSSYYLY